METTYQLNAEAEPRWQPCEARDCTKRLRRNMQSAKGPRSGEVKGERLAASEAGCLIL
jgi:hypothetical protein